MSYRNIYFDRKTNVITQWGWNSKGERDETTHFFSPYIYLQSVSKNEKEYIGIDGMPLVKKEFKTEWDKNKFVENYKGQVYFNLPPTQQFLLENYYEKDIQDLTQHPLKTFFIDIEVIANEFPDPKEAKFPITSVTIYDSISKKYYVWGVNRYDPYSCKDDLKDVEPEEIVYEFCENEVILLKKMLRFWRADFPDLLIGYNSYSFDLPYIVNRIEHTMGEGKSAKLSPVDNIYGVEKENRFGHKYTEYTIGGLSHLDYMVLYKYFTPGERESDSLDFVCEEELGEGKLDYEGMSLQELSRKKWDRFINYNIWDVKLMVMLDAKRKYLDIARFSAVSGFCNLDKALGKVSIITGVLAKQAMQDGKMIPSNKGEKALTKIPGGYVKATPPGLYKDIISFDAKSLYPNTIITLNISPETKVAKIMSRNDTHSIIYNFKTRKYQETPTKELKTFIRERNWSISGAGVFFDQAEKGICPKFIDNLYQQRVEIQKRLAVLEKEKLTLDEKTDEYKMKSDTINKLDTEQYLIKILLNSTYGALASNYFDLYDLDCAKSITMTGQAMIKEAEKITNEFIQTNWSLPNKDRCAAIDTDSNFFELTDVVNKLSSHYLTEDGDVTDEFLQIETAIKNNLNVKIREWAVEKLNSKDCRFEFARESVAPSAIWTGAKNYVMHIRNMKGVKTENIKYKGLSLVKATIPKQAKDIAKTIVKGMLSAASKKESDIKFFESYELFSKLSDSTISERFSLKVLDDYYKLSNGFDTVSGCPRHAKYALYYNHLLKILGLEKKYPKIENGHKVKIAYVKDNKYNLQGIAYLDVLPPEFEIEIDREKMFAKCIINCLKPLYAAVSWEIPDPKIQFENDLSEIFA